VGGPSEENLRHARVTLRSLVSDVSSPLPALNVVADAIRVELERRSRVAIIYIRLDRYGHLESLFGWGIVGEILDAVAQNLSGMVGSTLRRLDVVADFTLSDNAFVVLLSPPRSGEAISGEELLAVTRRVYERLQSLLLNDLAPGVFDRVHPSVGAATIAADDALTFEQTLQRGVALAMEAAEQQAAVYDDELEKALADCIEHDELEPVFEPVVDPEAQTVIGYRSSVRGPFYSPLRLPDVLLDVARRSVLVDSYGIAARATTVQAAQGLMAEDLLFLTCAAVELPNAGVVALSEFYSLNKALVPQHVVFELDAAELVDAAATLLRTLENLRELGFQLCLSGLDAHFASLEFVKAARPDYLMLDPVLVAAVTEGITPVEIVQLLVRFAARSGCQLIAPGVKDDEQVKALRRAGVELMSGEYFGRADTRLPKVTFGE
jgi:EAL domain-containing protein (putative c-di-GMP-specific phosphodiesterase class I)